MEGKWIWIWIWELYFISFFCKKACYQLLATPPSKPWLEQWLVPCHTELAMHVASLAGPIGWLAQQALVWHVYENWTSHNLDMVYHKRVLVDFEIECIGIPNVFTNECGVAFRIWRCGLVYSWVFVVYPHWTTHQSNVGGFTTEVQPINTHVPYGKT